MEGPLGCKYQLVRVLEFPNESGTFQRVVQDLSQNDEMMLVLLVLLHAHSLFGDHGQDFRDLS